jgi:streptomycin 6-kinase
MTPVWPDVWRVMSAQALADGIGGRVWRIRTEDGARAVIKQISEKARDDAKHALAYLSWRNGLGAIRLLDAIGDFQLLEDAGHLTLAQVLERDGDAEATRIAADVLTRLGAPGPAPVDLPSMRDRFASLMTLQPTADSLLREAQIRLEGLLALPHSPRPLHGDIHHDNILHGPRGWLAIDPHGLIGDPAYDAANLFYNPLERQDLRTSTDRAQALAGVLAPAVGRPVSVVLAYGFCHACLSSVWYSEDGEEAQAQAGLDVARAIRPLLDDAGGLFRVGERPH